MRERYARGVMKQCLCYVGLVGGVGIEDLSLKSGVCNHGTADRAVPSGDERRQVSEWRTSMAVQWVRLLIPLQKGHGSDAGPWLRRCSAARYTKKQRFLNGVYIQRPPEGLCRSQSQQLPSKLLISDEKQLRLKKRLDLCLISSHLKGRKILCRLSSLPGKLAP